MAASRLVPAASFATKPSSWRVHHLPPSVSRSGLPRRLDRAAVERDRPDGSPRPRRPAHARPVAQAARDRRREVHALPAPARQVGRIQLRGARGGVRAPCGRQGSRLRRHRDDRPYRSRQGLAHRAFHRRQDRQGHLPLGARPGRRLSAGFPVHRVSNGPSTMSLDRLEISLAINGEEKKARAVPVKNDPPRFVFSPVGRGAGAHRRRPGVADGPGHEARARAQHPGPRRCSMTRPGASTSTSSTASSRHRPSRDRGPSPPRFLRASSASRPLWRSRTSSTR